MWLRAGLSKRPSLARHSITRAPPLSLEASDVAAEMASPEASSAQEGKSAEWWRNLKASSKGDRRRSSSAQAGSGIGEDSK